MDGAGTWQPLPAFWDYMDAAGDRIRERVPDADASATQLIMMLNRTSATIVRSFESGALKSHDLSWSQFRILHCLWLAGPLDQRDVTEVTGLSRALVSSTAKLLLGRALVTSGSSAHDGRRRLLTLTDAGEATIVGAFRDQNQTEIAWAATLTPAERGILSLLLRKLARDETAG